MAGVIYWDTSAVLSLLLLDVHSAEARQQISAQTVHLVSTLVEAEFHACIARSQRDGHLLLAEAEATILAFERGPWRRLDDAPNALLLRSLAVRSQLRGADLWHLALAVTLRADLPELRLLTFDAKMREAARGEGLSI